MLLRVSKKYIHIVKHNCRNKVRFVSAIKLHFLQHLSDCTCKDFVSPSGHGNCLKVLQFPASELNGRLICYVNQPTSCTDAVDTIWDVMQGEKYSAQPCTIGKFVIRPHKLLILNKLSRKKYKHIIFLGFQ